MFKLVLNVFEKATTQHYQLLLDADPSKKAVDSYLARGICIEAKKSGSGVLVGCGSPSFNAS
ncbi:hypothetical protein [Liquorilactobacillus oeni]|uniref:Uncharacterized protein n=1 Tax=Liquorilactobacillus oeni DSM 19972 TaxID=1423777 RepID=A0A0R1MJ29_9LACO|nr:hypothetical protein [Liquorilactobacillus oeni]KRL04459.1 hypothetical protein FD46_GL001589 [Liquorilactobacillus oeni DSM 19972]